MENALLESIKDLFKRDILDIIHNQFISLDEQSERITNIIQIYLKKYRGVTNVGVVSKNGIMSDIKRYWGGKEGEDNFTPIFGHRTKVCSNIIYSDITYELYQDHKIHGRGIAVPIQEEPKKGVVSISRIPLTERIKGKIQK